MYIYTGFLNVWDWEWFTTLTLPVYPSFSESKIDGLRLEWTRSLCTEEGVQIGYYYSLTYKGSLPHLHLLMIGRNKAEKTLADVDRRIWERRWPYMAKIEIPESNMAVSNYLDRNISAWNADWGIYNKLLLKKSRNEVAAGWMDDELPYRSFPFDPERSNG